MKKPTLQQLRVLAAVSTQTCTNANTTRPIAMSPLLCDQCNRDISYAPQCSSGKHCWVIRHPRLSHRRSNKSIHSINSYWDKKIHDVKPQRDVGVQEHVMNL